MGAEPITPSIEIYFKGKKEFGRWGADREGVEGEVLLIPLAAAGIGNLALLIDGDKFPDFVDL